MIPSFHGPADLPPDVDSIVELAVTLAQRAGAQLLSERAGVVAVARTKSSYRDVVTAMDERAERLIVDAIIAARPDDAIVGEEGTDRSGTSDVTWLVDPVDGTVNYLYGLPEWATSIGVAYGGHHVIGVVDIPTQAETFVAIRGRGGHRRHADQQFPLAVNDPIELPGALIATGFGYETERRRMQAAIVASLIPEIRDLRRGGSCAVDLCSLAAGRIDGYFEIGPQPWDYAAGGLIAAEAGAYVTVTLIPGASDPLVAAAGPALHLELAKFLV